MPFVIGLLFFSDAMAAVKSNDEACDILKRTALQDHLVARGQPSGQYVCEDYSQNGGYFVFGLHFKLDVPTDNPQSNLVGWFAVSKKSGRVYEWDMANLTLGPIVQAVQ
jgi:hypothetical protein